MTTALSLLVAWLGASLLGLALGRIASDLRGRAVVHLLIEARGALLPFVVVAMWLSLEAMPVWLAIGLTAAATQGIAVARWIVRHDSDAATLAGDLALGHSGAGTSTRRAAARGAVSSTLAFTVVVVTALEALGARLPRTAEALRDSLGARMVEGGGTTWLAWVGAAGLVVGAELVTQAVLTGRAAAVTSRLLRGAARRV